MTPTRFTRRTGITVTEDMDIVSALRLFAEQESASRQAWRMREAADEIERLRGERDNWVVKYDNYRLAALYLYRYITDHVAIIGDKEIKAWHVAKDLYIKAETFADGEQE